MKKGFKLALLVLILAMGFWSQETVLSQAQEKTGIAGWEKGGAYDKHYNLSDFDNFKGTVTDIVEITPLPGMSPGVGLIVRDADDETVKVHLGPKSFVNLDSIGLRKSDNVKVKGAWAEINGEDVFMASKVKKGEYTELKVRLTKDGTPFWTMTPEQLAKEQQAKD